MTTDAGAYTSTALDPSKFAYTKEQINKIDRMVYALLQNFAMPVSDENFRNMYFKWYSLVSAVPLPAMLIQEPYIIRSRPSSEGMTFQEEADISYNSKCPEKVNPGRFNRKGESVFYAVLPSKKHQQIFVNAAVLESLKELINENGQDDVFYFHVAKFTVNRPFTVVNLCFEDIAMTKHPKLQQQLTDQLNMLRTQLPLDTVNTIIRFWRYVSKLFSIRMISEHHYMAGAALFSALRDYYKTENKATVNGLIYPSPMAFGDALNIVLMPSTVDLYLSADSVSILKYDRRGDENKIFTTYMCCEPSTILNGKLNITNVDWGGECGNCSQETV